MILNTTDDTIRKGTEMSHVKNNKLRSKALLERNSVLMRQVIERLSGQYIFTGIRS